MYMLRIVFIEIVFDTVTNFISLFLFNFIKLSLITK